MKFDSHLCLVSTQATPNLTPALDADLRPRRVVLAVSPDMRERAGWLEAVLKRHGVPVEWLDIPDPYDYDQCWECFAGWLEEQPGEVALNVTGGTKIMAMAAQDVFGYQKKPVFYVNVENDQVIHLYPRKTPFTLPARIKLSEYLEAHGYAVPEKPAKPDIIKDIRDFIDRLAYESAHLGSGLGKLNRISQQAKRSLISPSLDKHDLDSKALDELISMFGDAGMLELKDNRLVFPDENARRFVNGGWLEYLVYQSLTQLAPELGITDCAIGIKVVAPDGKTRNELDVACLLRNTLHLIECKSASLSWGDKMDETSGTEALYKLDALRRMGGLRTKAMLVDFRGNLRDADKRRASQMNLHIISGSQLRNLRGALKTWLLR